MVDPSEAEEQTKCKSPSVAAEDPRVADQNTDDGDGTAEEDGDACFQTPPTGSAEPSPCHTISIPETPSPKIVPSPQPPPQSEQDLGPKLHLDLYNFDSPAAEGSRYVLTSPRSLEACARCGVKPVELLPRPLSDFAREAPGRSMRVATGLFEVYERERHAKLRQCREERERIVREEKRRILQAAVNSSETAPKVATQAPKSTLLSKPSLNNLSTSPKSMQNGSSKIGSTSSLASSKGGFQGSRTKSTEQVRLTRQGSSGPPPVSWKNSGGKPPNTFPRSTPKPPAFPRANTTLASSVSKPATTQLNGVIGGHFGQHNGHLKLRGKSHSLESLHRKIDPIYSSTSTNTTNTCTSSESGASSSYSWDATPPRHSKGRAIVKEVKRRGLKAVSERDRKIAALMLARYQEEDIMSQTRFVAHLQWDSEKRMEEFRRENEEREKQKAVLQCQRVWQNQISIRNNDLTSKSEMLQRPS
ncbi:hypothetical protein WMY93_016751 [Mugilogobius chulae]|uniref:Uncharacterized protein n=1 Tax=Mugilogobius chulae TaxID=88201 RepID=A0AAW0NYF5_9GOBI